MINGLLIVLRRCFDSLRNCRQKRLSIIDFLVSNGSLALFHQCICDSFSQQNQSLPRKSLRCVYLDFEDDSHALIITSQQKKDFSKVNIYVSYQITKIKRESIHISSVLLVSTFDIISINKRVCVSLQIEKNRIL